jgi:hypothetical protein
MEQANLFERVGQNYREVPRNIPSARQKAIKGMDTSLLRYGEKFSYDKLVEWLNRWNDPCPVCGNDTKGSWSGYAMAIHKIYICIGCFERFYPEMTA